MTRREQTALGALGFILAVTAAWWALALWPLPDAAPAWLVRTRAVCFGALRDTLPSAAGAWGPRAPGGRRVAAAAEPPLPDTSPRLDRPAPPLGPVDQSGDTVAL